MFETNGADIKVERLMYELREAAVRSQQKTAGPEAAPTESSQQPSDETANGFRLQPSFQRSTNGQYHVEDLLRFHGADFVRNAYQALLLREPDHAGLTHHLEMLSTGRFNKIDVLASLQASQEARSTGIKIDGLRSRVAIRRLGRLPGIGYLVQLVVAVGRLPVLLQHIRQLEFYFWSQQQKLVDHQNQTESQFQDALAQVSAQMLAHTQKATEHQGRIETLHQSVDLVREKHERLATEHNDSKISVEHKFEHLNQLNIALDERLQSQTQALLQQQEQTARQQQHGEQLQQEIEKRFDDVGLQQQRIQSGVALQQGQLAKLIEGKADAVNITEAREQREHLLDAFYAAFEDQFRGDRKEIEERLQVYLPTLERSHIREAVLDIGCGRGEWLELLQKQGIKARGIDRNRVFVEECTARGFDVIEADALAHLRTLPDESINAVTSFHLVEHLELETLISLLNEIVRVLKPGGLLILETPNPENLLVGSYSFYADPTHRNPIPAPTLQFIVESRGLKCIDVLKLRALDDAKIEGDTEVVRRLNQYFYSAPDYGLIATKS